MADDAAADPRRSRPVPVRWADPYYPPGRPPKIGRISIDGVVWASVEWSEQRQAWCIEDAEGACLAHRAHIRGQEASKKAALALAKAMIADGRMPSPEQAEALRLAEIAERRAKLDKQPSVIRRRQEREERHKREEEHSKQRSDANWEERNQVPLWESLAEAFDFSDPDLWKSNSFGSLRPRLVIWMRHVVAKLQGELDYALKPPRRSLTDAGKAWHKQAIEEREAKLARAREILGWLEGDQVQSQAAE